MIHFLSNKVSYQSIIKAGKKQDLLTKNHPVGRMGFGKMAHEV
jgi:hypothetical protein